MAANVSSRLSSTEREAILNVLEEYTNALAIYHNTLKKPAEHDSDVPLDCIFPDPNDLEMSKVEPSPDDKERIEDLKERIVSAQLYEDSLYIRRLLEDVKEEIRERGTFEVLTKEVEDILQREKEEEALIAENEKLGRDAAELRKTMMDERAANEEQKRRTLKELAEEQRNIEKLKLIAAVELEYVTAWQRARCEQNSLRCNMEMEKLEKILNDWRARERNEQRVHDELTKFLIQETASIQEKTREWEERYVREKETYEKEIRQLRIQIESRRKELDELKEEYRGNQEFIDAYLAEKEALRKEKELKKHMRRSAIRIQAWWRGVMVRRKLGPYRPEEKKKKRPTKTKK